MNRLQDYIDKQKFNVVRQDLRLCVIKLTRLDVSVNVYFSLKELDEVFYNELYYSSDATGDTLGLIEGYFHIAQSKAVEGLDRVNIKELDYFFRKSNSIPSFEFYTPEMFEVLSIGEELRKFIFPKIDVNNLPILDTVNYGVFESLSYSDQLDFIEEYFSKFIFSSSEFIDLSFEFEVEEKEIGINVNKKISEIQRRYICTGLERELSLDNFTFLFSWPD